MRVLIPIDGSAGSFEAIRQVGPLLRPDRDAVALYCHPPQVSLRKSLDSHVAEVAQHSLAQAIFAEARQHLPEKLRAAAETITGAHEPKVGILLAAEKWSADLVAMGARGLTGMQRLLLGSVSRAVVHSGRYPVWVARTPPVGQSAGPRVLVACQCAESSVHPLHLLAQLSWPDTASFTVMTVIASIFAGRVPDWLQQQARSTEVEAMVQAWAREHDEETRASQARLEDAVRTMPPPLAGAKTIVEEGEPAHLILATAARDQSDLVVVGTRRDRPLGSTILGSTSEAVLNHAHCSVLVVPHVASP